METHELTEAERRVWRAYPRGETVDFRGAPGEDPAAGRVWGAERTVRAAVLRALLLRDDREDGEIASVNVFGARVTGSLNLKYAELDIPVRLRGCFFERVPELYSCRMPLLSLQGSVLPGLSAAALRLDGTLRLNDCRFTGAVRLSGARVGGAVVLDGAEVRPSEADVPGEPLVKLNQAEITDDLRAARLRVRGQVRLTGAVIGGSVFLSDAELSGPGGTALQAERLTVGADLHAMRLRAEGRLNVRGSQIPGQLILTSARLTCPGGTALRASSCTVGELWLKDGAVVRGAVNLRRSQLDRLHAPPGVWPETVRLDGLTYTTLAPHIPAERRLEVLRRDGDGYVPFAYEQLTAAYRRAGDDAAARTVQLAKQRRHRALLPRYARVWGVVQDVTVGYGYRPVRAALWLLSLLLVGTTAYVVRPPRPLKPAEAPEFSPVFYTLDLLLPIVDFGQERAFTSGGALQWLAYALVILGWVLATTIAAGITRSLSRQ
ncbi:membrane-associated oxidoreductase [Streptomyces sp. TRM 70351]|uniref:membrane-associated oxidoreductase n=1 Tax=Streptomyces sp. TRM 70351 TaxID=3116552 RepID=UPI002E7BE33C|nr:membrane-associated oxidoreductase [Streptomyces sp. TRM 70351]MEE1926965.1 membrane-associated oxidoreductase [Streptomyces sp. TRM 70351]